jgi:acetylornithine/N-succinyldiaminopimelate aminotransferase
VAAGENVVRILPPLNVSEAEMREAVAMLEQAAAMLEKQKVAAQ